MPLATFDPRKILVIDSGHLAEVILSLPALKAIRKRFRHSRITIAARKSAAGVIDMSGLADEIIEADGVELRELSKLNSIFSVAKLVKKVRSEHFDFVIDLHSIAETNLLGFVTGAPRRLFGRRAGKSLDYLANFSPKPPVDQHGSGKHLVDRYLDVLKPLNLTVQDRTPRVATDPQEDQHIERLLKKTKVNLNRIFVGLFPGADDLSHWPIEKFVELADSLVRNRDVQVVVFRGEENRESLARWRKLFRPPMLVLESLDVPALASGFVRLSVLVSNDPGSLHVAAAVGTPTVGLMPTAESRLLAPVGEQHKIICHSRVPEIPVEKVFEAACEVLARGRVQSLFTPFSW